MERNICGIFPFTHISTHPSSDVKSPFIVLKTTWIAGSLGPVLNNPPCLLDALHHVNRDNMSQQVRRARTGIDSYGNKKRETASSEDVEYFSALC